jgi:hypothetical protein
VSFSRRGRRIAFTLVGLLAIFGAPQAASAQTASADDVEVDGPLPGGETLPASPQTAVFLIGGAAALAVMVHRSRPRPDAKAPTPSDGDFDGGPVIDLTELRIPAGV